MQKNVDPDQLVSEEEMCIQYVNLYQQPVLSNLIGGCINLFSRARVNYGRAIEKGIFEHLTVLLYIMKYTTILYVDSEGPDQTAWMSRLV